MSEQKRPYIEIEHFSFYYPERTEKVLDDLTLTVEQGEFLVLCGPSGCGKSTLLRQLKTVLAPHGRRLGSIRFEGCPLEELDQREQSAGIGFVQQDPENQIVTDKVWHELAFGLESLGYDTPTIRRRVAEMAFRHSDLVLQERHGAVRRAEAAPEFGVYHGDAAQCAHSGRTDQSA